MSKSFCHLADFESLEPRRLMSVSGSLQQGVLGYSGTQDTHIRQDAPATSVGSAVVGLADADDNAAGGHVTHDRH